jgi:fructokinase
MPNPIQPGRDVTDLPDQTARDASVVVIGDALIDELHDETGAVEFVGGAALNVAVGLAILGLDTTLVAMVGDDEGGARIREFLAAHGVRLLASPSANGTARAVSTRRLGEPLYEFNAAAQARRIQFSDEQIRSALSDAHLVVISSFPFDDEEQFAALRDAIADPQSRLILDPNPRAGMMHDRTRFARNFEQLAASALVTKVSDEDAALLGHASLAALEALVLASGSGSNFVLTTAGAAGCAVASRDGARVVVPIHELPGPVIDTMGAGDATLATISASIAANGVPSDSAGWAHILDTAMLIAAATCRAPGALIQLPPDLPPDFLATEQLRTQ